MIPKLNRTNDPIEIVCHAFRLREPDFVMYGKMPWEFLG
jgi:hypothetical protein